MFGRPKLADAAFLMGEISNGLAATANALEAEHPNPSSTDTQAIMAWVFAVIIHPIMMWGRTDEKALSATWFEFGAMMSQHPEEGRWSLDELSDEIERCQRLLRTHVSSVDYDGIKEASTAYYNGLLRKAPKPVLAEDDFIRFAVTATLASLTRLKNSGHIKIR